MRVGIIVSAFLVLALTGLLTQAMGIGADPDDNEEFLNGTSSYTNSSAMGGTIFTNGTEGTYEVEGFEVDIAFDASVGALAILISGVAVAMLAGIRFVSTGLSEFTIRVIVKVFLFYSFWLSVSMFALRGFDIMPFGLGWITYLFLSLFFSFGVMEDM